MNGFLVAAAVTVLVVLLVLMRPFFGRIAPGADADIVVFDPDRAVTITAGTLHQNCDYTPYEGFEVKGWPQTVLSRGEVIVREGRFTGAAGRGQYLKR